MKPPSDKVEYCWCGLRVLKGLCPRHKGEWYTHEKYQKEKRVNIGKYSGKSRRYKGAYEKD